MKILLPLFGIAIVMIVVAWLAGAGITVIQIYKQRHSRHSKRKLEEKQQERIQPLESQLPKESKLKPFPVVDPITGWFP